MQASLADSEYRALRSIDGGARDGVHERLVSSGGPVLIVGAGVRATADGGGHWLDNGVECSEVYVVDGSTVLGRHEGSFKLGAMEQGGPRWLATLTRAVESTRRPPSRTDRGLRDRPPLDEAPRNPRPRGRRARARRGVGFGG